MNSRERFAAAVARKPVDRCPIDIGGTTLTSMAAGCQKALREFLGFTGEAQAANSGVDERILQWAGTDFRGVGGIVNLPGPHTQLMGDTAFVDCWGVKRELLGSYWEITQSPLRDATIDDLKAFRWPTPRIEDKQLDDWVAAARRLRDDGQYVVVAEHPMFGILELGCWMCGYDDFLIRMATDPDFVRLFFDKVLAIQLELIEQYYGALGGLIDLTTSGDDFGTQMGPMLSPAMFGQLIAEPFARRISRTKELGRCLYWHHTCGGVVPLLDSLIGCGVDILNPIQTSAAGMVPAELKARFGSRLVFWGGLDVQAFLPKASPAEVAAEVRSLTNSLGRHGGYVIAPAHNMQDDIPPANIAAWVESMRL